ncbi:hypothetical protein Ciccas_009609 [Cichlidogyrus casuarinus]|uniref:Uncharacterized protein n=1 Tax=Cichlidogyrus casuarinus TaxID=1844966 RepID=A0ABD2PXI6_9PLAT
MCRNKFYKGALPYQLYYANVFCILVMVMLSGVIVVLQGYGNRVSEYYAGYWSACANIVTIILCTVMALKKDWTLVKVSIYVDACCLFMHTVFIILGALDSNNAYHRARHENMGLPSMWTTSKVEYAFLIGMTTVIGINFIWLAVSMAVRISGLSMERYSVMQTPVNK